MEGGGSKASTHYNASLDITIRAHCQHLQGAVRRPKAVLQLQKFAHRTTLSLQLSLGAKEQGYTLLSALVYCQPSPGLQQESKSLPPLPHGEAPDLPRRPYEDTKQEERDRGQMPT